MFFKKTPILYFSQDKIKVSLVSTGKTNRVLKADETGWTPESLKETLIQAKKQLKTSKFRLLLADDLNYVVTLKIPLNTPTSQERQLVLAKLTALVPEILTSTNWDFKETGKKDQTEKEVIAFAPVQDKFLIISQALTEAGIDTEAIEPEVIARLRNEDPLIGIALKSDLKGKDEKVLNINPQPPKPTKAPIVNKKLVIIFLIVFIIIGLIVGGVLTSRNALNKTKKVLPSPSPEILVSPLPSAEASPSALPVVDLTKYKLQVLNGTGGKGVAAAVKDILTAEGFTSIAADNADIQNFTLTQVELKPNTPKLVFETIDRALNDAYEVTHSAQLLTADSDYDVVITVGQLKSKE
ncbi:MAG: LytR C-terminal domain-containing protein [Candidatus Beckwithbacteria bacterium]